MMKHIFIINGPAGAGKDTFASMIGSLVPTVNRSSVDIIKEAARILGWRGTKEDVDRKFLSDLKYLTSKYSNVLVAWMLKQAQDFFEDEIHEVMFIHIREPEEIAAMKKLLSAKTLLVTRAGVEPNQSNEADANVLNYDYDIIIENSGTLGDLKIKAEEFVERIKNE